MLVSSPRTWGCFHSLRDRRRAARGLPHARGGVSRGPRPRLARRWSSPRTWGCFTTSYSRETGWPVFPTHVGVFLIISFFHALTPSLPHARGGVSAPDLAAVHRLRSSPRTWGCFLNMLPTLQPISVFPTHVGVFPTISMLRSRIAGLPHARGGVSRA